MVVVAVVVVGRLVYSWIESMSTEKTRAPSLARSAASGRPTTSDLQGAAQGYIYDGTLTWTWTFTC